MRRTRFWLVTSFMVLLCAAMGSPPVAQGSAPAGFDPSQSDAKAIEIADAVLEAIGADAWSEVRFLKFQYSKVQGEKILSQRTHYWDRKIGRSRLEAETSKTKRKAVVIVDHETKAGEAAIDGKPVAEAQSGKIIQNALKYWLEDSLWVITPFRLKEPGSRLRYEGEKVAGPITYDMITAQFVDNPEVKYRFYVNRDTKMFDSMAFVLKGRNVTPVAFNWVEWSDIAGMKFSLKKNQSGGEVDILISDIEVFDSMPATAFTSTAPLDSSEVAAVSGK